jgi:hypothetical protein
LAPPPSHDVFDVSIAVLHRETHVGPPRLNLRLVKPKRLEEGRGLEWLPIRAGDEEDLLGIGGGRRLEDLESHESPSRLGLDLPLAVRLMSDMLGVLESADEPCGFIGLKEEVDGFELDDDHGQAFVSEVDARSAGAGAPINIWGAEGTLSTGVGRGIEVFLTADRASPAVISGCDSNMQAASSKVPGVTFVSFAKRMRVAKDGRFFPVS